MIEIDIPKDIREYDSKLVGPFTTRQTICLVAGGAVAFAVYSLIKNIELPSDAQLIITGIFIIPFILFGWFKPYGMALEQFLKVALISNFIAPAKRIYEVNNMYIEKKKRLTKKEKEKKKKGMYKSSICVPFE